MLTVACTGGADSDYNFPSRMISDGSYNTNSSGGACGSCIYWQSMGGSGLVYHLLLQLFQMYQGVYDQMVQRSHHPKI